MSQMILYNDIMDLLRIFSIKNFSSCEAALTEDGTLLMRIPRGFVPDFCECFDMKRFDERIDGEHEAKIRYEEQKTSNMQIFNKQEAENGV